MHWNKIILVVFFGIFLVGQLVTSAIYAQDTDSGSESKESNGWFDMDLASFIGILVAIGTSAIGIIFQVKEHQRARRERNLSIVEGYSNQLTELKNKESVLKTKKDCETYAQSYLDLMDQIAYLCANGRGISKDVRDYFENDFAYALTLIWWLKNKELVKEESINGFFDIPEEKPTEIHITKKNFEDKSFPWYDLIHWCLYEEDEKKVILPFDNDQLPDAMSNYNDLHEEDIEGTLEVVKGYGEKLNELSRDESKLKSALEWELYATSYLDTLDSIAYLLRKNIIPKGVDDYFENYFAYGLRMIIWLEEKELVDKIKIVKKQNNESAPSELSCEKWLKTANMDIDREYSWPDLLNWCKKKNIEPYDNEQLPQKMIDAKPKKMRKMIFHKGNDSLLRVN